MAVTTLFNDGWQFQELAYAEENMTCPSADTAKAAGYVSVPLPHDWLIEDTHDLYRDSIGWYRKTLYLTEVSESKEYLVNFDGVYMDSAVFVNGKEVCQWKYGYSAFEVNLTNFLKAGENVLEVRVVNQYLNTRWYSGAGIFRDVHFKERDKTHLVTDGIYVTPLKVGDVAWEVTFDVEVQLADALDTCSLSFAALQEDGTRKQLGTLDLTNNTLSAPLSMDWIPEAVAPFVKNITNLGEANSRMASATFSYAAPKLWDVGEGNLYTVQVALRRGETLLEVQNVTFGFREFAYVPAEGFFINGRHLRINGACEHHDHGALGAVFHKDACRRKFKTLQDMGVNGVRTSHNMPAKGLMEVADEMGMLIDSEAFDMWEMSKTPYDYGRFFADWHSVDVASWVRRDRNHPSIIMWSIGNEIPDTAAGPHGEEITDSLLRALAPHDPKHHAPSTIGSNFLKWDPAQRCQAKVDLAGYNYGEYLYEEHHEKYPDWVIYGSETSSILQSRGIYHFPKAVHVLSDDDEQCSALGNSISGWGAKSYEDCIFDDRDCAFSMGQFIWTGHDYIGESTPYDTKNSYFGQIDTAGYPKDSFYIFKAEWTDYKKEPFVHVFPYWDFNEGQIIDVQVCTNAPCAELFLNGKSLGKQAIDHAKSRKTVLDFAVPYEKGTLLAVAYDETGAEIAKCQRTSFKDATALCVKAEEVWGKLVAGSLLYVDIFAVDENGNPVENANNRVQVNVEGPARLVGLDNGDSADLDSYKGVCRRLFQGKLLAIVQLTGEAGEVRLSASSEGLEEATAVLVVAGLADARQGAAGSLVANLPSAEGQESEAVLAVAPPCLLSANQPLPLYTGGSKGVLLENEKEIPIRKIELSVADLNTGEALTKRQLTKERPAVAVCATLLPDTATYEEISWRAVTDTGIELSYIEITPLEKAGNVQKVQVLAKGDGAFRLRAVAKNGGSVSHVQSNLEFEAIGLGAALFDPYEEVTMGLNTDRSDFGVAAGIEHGVNFMGEGEDKPWPYAGFDNLDFGTDLADEVTLYIFANTGGKPVRFAIWDGVPKAEGSRLLLDTTYQKPPQWMVFQEETYKLPLRLTGLQKLYFATPDSFQFRGFAFAKIKKAYASLDAAAAEQIYGDSFKVCGSKVEEIGNNVSLVFEGMDFSEGAKALRLFAHTDLEKNPFQLRFTPADGGAPVIQLVEVFKSADYEEKVYALAEPLQGEGKVELIFLPGSHFDLGWLRFE